MNWDEFAKTVLETSKSPVSWTGRRLARMGAIGMLICAFPLVRGGDLDTSRAAPFRPDRILVKSRKGLNLTELVAFHEIAGTHVLREFPALEHLQVLQLPDGAKVEAMVARYERSGLVEYAEPDLLLFTATAPNDPYYTGGSLWHLHNTGQTSGLADADLDGPEAWDTMNSAGDVVIAIVDTGVRYTHEDLAANMWVNPGEIPDNGKDDDGNGFIDDVYGINAVTNTGDPWDTLGHGTEVAGIAGAHGNNGVGVTGVSWRVKIMACRFFDDAGNASVSDAIQCIDYARTKGARVINASFGSAGYSYSFYTAINSCRSAGIVFVAAAGNDSGNNDAAPYYPASYDLDNIVAVAATTRADALAEYSNYGATSVDLGAPGSAITTTDASSDSAFTLGSGTSYAAPVVTGAFALMRARYPAETYKQLIDRVLEATDPLPGLSGKCMSGGRLNLHKAIGPSLVAEFTANPMTGEAPLTVTFNDISFGNVTSWWWEFGDGSTSAHQHPTHTYITEGNFMVKLTVQTIAGATSSKTQTVSAVANYQIRSALYEWIDPAGMQPIALSDDGVSPAQSLPFAFRFYDRTYTQLYAGANGLMGFDNQNLSTAQNSDLPNPAAPNNILCPFWDDLNPAAGGAVYIGTFGTAPSRKVVVSWVGVPHKSNPPGSYTFQAVLEEGSHQILFQYQNMNLGGRNPGASGKSATIGVEHSSGRVAARYSHNGSTLVGNNQAIRFAPTSTSHMRVTPSTDFLSSGNVGGPFTTSTQVYRIENISDAPLDWSVFKSANWIDLSASSGSLNPGEAAEMILSLNSAVNALAAGSYTDVLRFANSSNGNGDKTTQVQLTVLAPPVLTVLAAEVTGELRLRLTGEPYRNYVIEAATDWSKWTPTSTNTTGSDGTILMTFPMHQQTSQRFYRGREAP